MASSCSRRHQRSVGPAVATAPASGAAFEAPRRRQAPDRGSQGSSPLIASGQVQASPSSSVQPPASWHGGARPATLVSASVNARSAPATRLSRRRLRASGRRRCSGPRRTAGRWRHVSFDGLRGCSSQGRAQTMPPRSFARHAASPAPAPRSAWSRRFGLVARWCASSAELGFQPGGQRPAPAHNARARPGLDAVAGRVCLSDAANARRMAPSAPPSAAPALQMRPGVGLWQQAVVDVQRHHLRRPSPGPRRTRRHATAPWNRGRADGHRDTRAAAASGSAFLGVVETRTLRASRWDCSRS